MASKDAAMAIAIDPAALTRMIGNRAFVEKIAARGDEVYGLSTGVGVRKKGKVAQGDAMLKFQERMVRDHAVGLGPDLSPVVTRAAAVLLLNSLCLGRSCVRPEVAVRIAERLSHGIERPLRGIPRWGTTGVGDVVSLSHLTVDLMLADDPPLPLAAGEALPLIAQSSVVTAHAAVAIDDAALLLRQMTTLAALDIEGKIGRSLRLQECDHEGSLQCCQCECMEGRGGVERRPVGWRYSVVPRSLPPPRCTQSIPPCSSTYTSPGFAANISPYHKAAGEARPYPGCGYDGATFAIHHRTPPPPHTPYCDRIYAVHA
jgi:hypothetical protein